MSSEAGAAGVGTGKEVGETGSISTPVVAAASASAAAVKKKEGVSGVIAEGHLTFRQQLAMAMAMTAKRD